MIIVLFILIEAIIFGLTLMLLFYKMQKIEYRIDKLEKTQMTLHKHPEGRR